jgi:type VII secretion protein EccB
VGLLGFVVFGFFSPAPSAPDSGIVISTDTGAVYVVQKDPKLLIPMTNLASARLFLLAQTAPDTAQQGSSSSSGGDSGPAGGDVHKATQASLAKLPLGRLTGIPNGPEMLPTPDQRIDPRWMVCDTVKLEADRDANNQSQTLTTTVLAGIAPNGKGLEGNKALLLEDHSTHTDYLVYRAPQSDRHPGARVVRAKVDLTNTPLASAFSLDKTKVRQASAGLISAIPEAAEIRALRPDNFGSTVSYLPNVKVGQVLEVSRSGTTPDFYVVTTDGLIKVSSAVADLVRFSTNTGSTDTVKVEPAAITSVNRIDPPTQIVDYPAEVPQVMPPVADNAVTCLNWKADGGSEVTDVTTAANLAIPDGMAPVKQNQPGADGVILNGGFFIAPGKAGVVRDATSSQDFTRGPIRLITGRGLQFGIPDAKTASALGLGDASAFPPAPDSILRLLPMGPELNRNEALRSWDGMSPTDKGLLPSVQPGATGTNGG